MEQYSPDERYVIELSRQRNLCIFVAVAALASIGLTIPHKVVSYRELKSVNEHTVSIQETIVEQQKQLAAVQDQILQVQGQIRKQLSR